MSMAGQQAHDPPAQHHDGSQQRVRFGGRYVLLGAVVTLLLTFLIVWTIEGVHGSNNAASYLAKLFFPWTMTSTAVTKHLTSFAILFGMAQYPLYGIILDWARATG